MKIYFVLLRPSNWDSFVTTNEELAKEKLAENPEYVLRESELWDVDFEPVETTYVTRYAAMRVDWIEPNKYMAFTPTYKEEPSPNWVQGVPIKNVPLLADGMVIENPEEGVLTNGGVHFKKQ